MFGFAGVRSRAANALLAPIFVLPALLFVLRLVGLDRRLIRTTAPEAMGWILRRYYPGARLVRGTIPKTGPVLFAGNHPGLGDLPALVELGGRDDVVAVAKRRPLMQDMRGVLARCIVIDAGLRSRASAVRTILDTFRAGGAVVIYPAGGIEADPAVFPDEPFLSEWPPFIDMITKRAAKEGLRVPVIPVYTEGVHRVPAMLRVFLRSRSGRNAQEGRAALITMMSSIARSLPVTVAVGDPIIASGEQAPGHSVTKTVRSAIEHLRDGNELYVLPEGNQRAPSAGPPPLHRRASAPRASAK